MRDFGVFSGILQPFGIFQFLILYFGVVLGEFQPFPWLFWGFPPRSGFWGVFFEFWGLWLCFWGAGLGVPPGRARAGPAAPKDLGQAPGPVPARAQVQGEGIWGSGWALGLCGWILGAGLGFGVDLGIQGSVSEVHGWI